MSKRVAIDLEMCKVPKIYRTDNYLLPMEIIQIGAVLMDENNEIIDEFSSYVKPAYGVIDCFIKNLTGIKGINVKTAQPLEAVIKRMMEWIRTKDVCFYSWSDADYYQLRNELRAKGLESDEYTPLINQRSWIDYQKKFETRFQFGKLLSLKDALFYLELEPVGKLHDGFADAYNTARIIAEIERNPERLFLIDRIRKNEQESILLGTSLGDLLQEFRLQIA